MSVLKAAAPWNYVNEASVKLLFLMCLLSKDTQSSATININSLAMSRVFTRWEAVLF